MIRLVNNNNNNKRSLNKCPIKKYKNCRILLSHSLKSRKNLSKNFINKKVSFKTLKKGLKVRRKRLSRFLRGGGIQKHLWLNRNRRVSHLLRRNLLLMLIGLRLNVSVNVKKKNLKIKLSFWRSKLKSKKQERKWNKPVPKKASTPKKPDQVIKEQEK